ncbi:MAG: hypothetical protein H6839_05295 [Planctomycetes bacterium]|nr:hypothetical protein [Planctomycetota bacterium]
MRASIFILSLLLLAGCAQTDPYARMEHVTITPNYELTPEAAVDAFNDRWPEQFKCVQTVTIDFRIVTRTLVGYLVVQQPGKFRLQGMSEQGLKLFDIAFQDGEVHKVFAAEEFDAHVLADIARDIERVFLKSLNGTATVRSSNGGTRALIQGDHAEIAANFVGEPPLVDWFEYRQSERALFRVDQYEGRMFGDLYLPSVIVLREPGIQSDGPPYKLTIKITDFTVRDKPWPDKLFEAKEGG